jgi:hypothetical protein
MEGCLYKNYASDSYCLIDSVASYFVVMIDLETFEQQFIQKDAIEKDFELIEFNSKNINEVLYNYEMFQNKIDMADFKDFNYIIFNQTKHYIRNWRDVYNFILNPN